MISRCRAGLKTLFQRGGRRLQALSNRRQHSKIYREFSNFTMVPEQTFTLNLALAEIVRPVQGCIVECGVWRGGMSAGLCRVLGPEREYFLLDSYEGLPPAQQIDGAAALHFQTNKDWPNYNDNCSAGQEFADHAMQMAGATRYHLIKGWFQDTVPRFRPAGSIALLRLDGDWYESTKVCLDHLFDMVAVGGLIILDDYFYWDGCSRAVHDFLSQRNGRERIEAIDRLICFVVKMPRTTDEVPWAEHWGNGPLGGV